MRTINKIIIHCSATKEGKDFGVDDIRRWHKNKGWVDIGYHYVIELNGSVMEGRKISVAGAHCSGHNLESIGICYVGGLDEDGNPKDTRTPEQKESLIKLIANLKQVYKDATIHGHNEFSSKACPSFSIKDEYNL